MRRRRESTGGAQVSLNQERRREGHHSAEQKRKRRVSLLRRVSSHAAANTNTQATPDNDEPTRAREGERVRRRDERMAKADRNFKFAAIPQFSFLNYSELYS
jgi:hypothetical protein